MESDGKEEMISVGIPNAYHTFGLFHLKKEANGYSWKGLKFTKKINEDFFEFKDCLFIGGSIISKENYEGAKNIYQELERSYEIWVTEKKDFPVALISEDQIDKGKFHGILIAPRIDDDFRNEILDIVNFKEAILKETEG